jgi:hypothetical protein
MELIIGCAEPVVLVKGDKRKRVVARIDTGARSSSIDADLAWELGLEEIGRKKVRNSISREERPLVNISFYLAGKRIDTKASVSTRSHMNYPMLVGREDLDGFLVEPTKKEISQPL